MGGLVPDKMESSTPLIIGSTVVATVALMMLAKTALYPKKHSVIPNPLKTTIPYLCEAELKAMEYKTDAFPGARDVDTPYGAIRIYEWGPEDGKKVLFVHGISTSCMTLSKMAHGLVNLGYRVMLFDLFGRGFSDGVGDLPHDTRLYTSQMLLALASSPFPWTGDKGMRVLGYSLGGSIAVHFATTFPHMVESLVLLAPAGLIRAENFGTASRIMFQSGLIPERVLAILTKKRLKQPLASSVKKQPPAADAETAAGKASSDVEDIEHSPTTPRLRHLGSESYLDVLTEAADPSPGEEVTPLERRVLRYVSWMVEHHAGFVPAFMSCIRHAPLTEQQKAWSHLAGRKPGTTLIMLGRDDELVNAEDYRKDALELVGGEKSVLWKTVGGGHDFVMTHAREVMKEIEGFWGPSA